MLKGGANSLIDWQFDDSTSPVGAHPSESWRCQEIEVCVNKKMFHYIETLFFDALCRLFFNSKS